MPIDIETFESASVDQLDHAGETNADRVMGFLASHPDKAFTQSEISESAGVKTGSISVVLARLESEGLVRHRGIYWALGEADDVAAYINSFGSNDAVDRFGEEAIAEWLRDAADTDAD